MKASSASERACRAWCAWRKCAELIQAVSKRLRGRPDPGDNLAEEMADVYICLGMLRDMYGVTDERLESWIDRKTKRQAERNRA